MLVAADRAQRSTSTLSLWALVGKRLPAVAELTDVLVADQRLLAFLKPPAPSCSRVAGCVSSDTGLLDWW